MVCRIYRACVKHGIEMKQRVWWRWDRKHTCIYIYARFMNNKRRRKSGSEENISEYIISSIVMFLPTSYINSLLYLFTLYHFFFLSLTESNFIGKILYGWFKVWFCMCVSIFSLWQYIVCNISQRMATMKTSVELKMHEHLFYKLHFDRSIFLLRIRIHTHTHFLFLFKEGKIPNTYANAISECYVQRARAKRKIQKERERGR